MADMCVFCIGTWHYHTERENVIVKLHEDCRYTDLGLVRQGGLFRANESAPAHVANQGYKLLCDGANSLGDALGRQANTAVDQIIAAQPDNVRLVGHSRGAVLAMMIATRLAQRGAATPCQLFLYDPVKRCSKSMSAAGTLGANVRKVRIIAAEDEGNSTAGVSHFKLMQIKGGGISPANWIRIPGTHGTMTQVNCPIGIIGYMLAAEWLTRTIYPTVPMRLSHGIDDVRFLQMYAYVNAFNGTSVSHRRFRDDQTVRHVNDFDPATGRIQMKRVTRGGNRTKRLNKLKINRFAGSGFLINEDHYRRFALRYRKLAAVIAGTPVPEGNESRQAYRQEYYRYRRIDPRGWGIMRDAGVAPPPAHAAIPR